MKKSIIYLVASTFLLINCGSESKANPINESINNTEETSTTIDTSVTENVESISIETVENSEKQSPENITVKKPLTTVKTLPISDIVIAKETVIETNEEIVTVVEQVFNHQTFDDLLKKHVTSSGKVNYKGIKGEVSKLDAYIKELNTQYPNLNSWSKNKQLAFWINVYNAHTIKLIVDNYPVASITKLKGGKPWDYKFIKLGDKTYTLNEVENDIIRPKYNEPRIHFAVNCAAKSCPKLMNKAWTEDNLNSALTTQTKAFLANTTENTLGANEIKISKIFDWYNADFIKSGSLISFIKKFSAATINDNAKVTYNEYNWDLNE